jgi:hypothetical protein
MNLLLLVGYTLTLPAIDKSLLKDWARLTDDSDTFEGL